MITADPKSHLGYICQMVDEMEPGQFLEIDRLRMMNIVPLIYGEVEFTPADRVLENIVGSGFTHSYEMRMNGNVVFARHRETGKRYYMSPDHRSIKGDSHDQ